MKVEWLSATLGRGGSCLPSHATDAVGSQYLVLIKLGSGQLGLGQLGHRQSGPRQLRGGAQLSWANCSLFGGRQLGPGAQLAKNPIFLSQKLSLYLPAQLHKRTAADV